MINEKLPGMMFGFGFLGTAGVLLLYFLYPELITHSRPNKRIIKALVGICVVFISLVIVSMVVNVSDR